MRKTILSKLQLKGALQPKDGDKLKSLVIDDNGNVKASEISDVNPISVIEVEGGEVSLEPNMLLSNVIIENATGITSVGVGDAESMFLTESFAEAVSDKILVFNFDLIEPKEGYLGVEINGGNPDEIKIKVVVLSV